MYIYLVYIHYTCMYNLAHAVDICRGTNELIPLIVLQLNYIPNFPSFLEKGLWISERFIAISHLRARISYILGGNILFRTVTFSK